MRHALLDRHNKIGWDIDGTIIDGPNAKFFREYIRANPDKEHHLITFRDEEWADDVYRELDELGLPRVHIASLNAIPQTLWQAHAVRKVLIRPDEVARYLEWKGATAAELGCTVLLDDMRDQVIQGCVKHGVAYIDSWSPEFQSPLTQPSGDDLFL